MKVLLDFIPLEKYLNLMVFSVCRVGVEIEMENSIETELTRNSPLWKSILNRNKQEEKEEEVDLVDQFEEFIQSKEQEESQDIQDIQDLQEESQDIQEESQENKLTQEQTEKPTEPTPVFSGMVIHSHLSFLMK